MECFYHHKWKKWDEVIESDASMDDIDTETIDEYIKSAKESGRLTGLQDITVTKLLENLRLLENGKLKRGGIVLFGKNPNRFYDNIQVKISRLGSDYYDFKFQDILEGNIIRLLKEIPKHLNRKFFNKPVDFENFQRIEKGEFPVGAIREMILNAIIHRDYMGDPTEIMIYDECFSTLNAGLLPLELTIESLSEQHPSIPRNPLIADVCFKGGYIDACGGGMQKIINLSKEAGLQNPGIKVQYGEFLVRMCK